MPGKVHRAVARRRTVEFAVGDKRYFIKIHFGCGWREIFKEWLQGRLPVLSARCEWRAIERLNVLRIPTLNVVGKGLRGWNPARLESFVITEALEGMQTLEDLVIGWVGLKTNQRVQLKRLLIQKTAAIVRSLHINGLNHRDCYLCHFMVHDRDWSQWQPEEPLKVYLIDLHRVQIRSQVPRRWSIKDLGSLLFSALDCGLTSRDLLRFIEAYEDRHWRLSLQERPQFWRDVLQRSINLYKEATGQSPQLPGWIANIDF